MWPDAKGHANSHTERRHPEKADWRGFLMQIRQSMFIAASLLFVTVSLLGAPPAGNRLTYLNEPCNPYYVHKDFPKLITPQWVGEEGVEAVIILAIDDMRGHEKWETYLRPILNRLKQIDGRAPVSIMTCNIDPKHPHLQQWLNEGLSIEVHTIDHPCPLLQGGDFSKAKSTYDRCVDLMNQIPGNKPVAFRMPCCDSLNTLSPRFFTEIFNKTTEKGNYLQMDTSVFNVFTSDDPALPKELVLDADGQERFKKYLPSDRTFVNTIENYPYPYVIDHLCWEFPCLTPSDWAAQHKQKPNNPKTIEDWKAAIDCTVIKQGVLNLVFHPHNWIKPEQVIEMIDHAVRKHGKKVKFLTFKEALERLNKNVLDGQPLRKADGSANQVRLLDLDQDGLIDVVHPWEGDPTTRYWKVDKKNWVAEVPLWNDYNPRVRWRDRKPKDTGIAFGFPDVDERLVGFTFGERLHIVWPKSGKAKEVPGVRAEELLDRHANRQMAYHKTLRERPFYSPAPLRDIDGDGVSEWIARDKDGVVGFYRMPHMPEQIHWKKLPAKLPPGVDIPTDGNPDSGLRFIDLDQDGIEDLVFSNNERYSIHLWDKTKEDWTREVVAANRGTKPADEELPPIVRADGSNNGFWVHSKMLVWQNEDTAKLKDLIDRRPFAELLRDVEPGPKNAADGLKSLKARPGFTVEQMAAEPLTMDPVAFEWGPDGKLWVAEMADYPKGVDGNGKPGGRVRYLEDSDGDGKYDKTTLFLQDVRYPTGVMPWKKGVIVSTAPDIFYAEDTDGDGQADKREVLYSGFAEGNQQHRVNGLVWGLDNWIHLANGDSGGSVKSIKTGKTVNISGRDVRIRPDTGEIDTVTGQTQFGRNRDDWGNWFGCNNANPMYQFVLEDRYLRRNPHYAGTDPRVPVSVNPGVAPVFPRSVTRARFNDLHTANRFTSACSTMVYRDTLFGPEFSNSCFVSEPVHNLVHREVIKPNGVTFISQRADDEQQSEFLASDDNWFRPTMTKTGPDGALWVADMYRHVIEHPEWIPLDWQKRLDLRAGHDKGRLYRVYPTAAKPRAMSRLDKLTTPELVEALRSPSGWQRDTAQRLLIEKRDPAAVSALIKLANQAREPLARLHALCTLDGLGALNADLLASRMGDTHPGIRRHAIRLVENIPQDSPKLVAALLKRVDDADPQVQLQLACTLGEIDSPDVGRALGELAQNAKGDRFLFAAAMSSINKQNLPGVLTSVLNRADGREPNGNFLEQLLALASAYGDQAVVHKLLEQATTATDGKFAAWQFGAVRTLLETLARQNKSLAELTSSKDPQIQTVVVQLRKLLLVAVERAKDTTIPVLERVSCIHILGRDTANQTHELATLADLLEPTWPSDIRSAAAESLYQSGSVVAPGILVEFWKSYSPTLRGQVLDLMLSRPATAELLVAAIEQEAIEPQAFDAARRQRLLSHPDAKIRTRAAKVLAAMTSTRQQVLTDYQLALTLPGNAAKGQQLFSKTCAQCHKLAGMGHEVGPDLLALTDKSPEALLVAVLDPNRAVEAKFLNFTAITRSGQVVSGMLASESGNSITLRAAEAKDQTILRAELDELVGTSKSTMPEGLEKDLKPQDVADLIAFVRANVAVPKRKEFFGNVPAVVSGGSGGRLELTSKTAEIYGPTLVLETQYGNLGYWTHNDDHAVWTIEVKKPGTYSITFDYACPIDAAGQIWRLDGGEQTVTGKVTSTGTWDDYRQVEVGEISLTKGRQRLTMRAAEPLKGPLLDLKGIRLTLKE